MLMEPISTSNTPVKNDISKMVKPSKSSNLEANMLVEPASAVNRTNKGVDSDIESIPREEERKTATEKQIKQAVERVNKVAAERTKCAFSYHEGTKTVSIKIINEETDEVIKEIPPEKSLEMLQKMWELSGMFVDEKR